VADVEREHAHRSALEQHVGEPARRCPDVERRTSTRIDGEHVQRVRELDAAAADVRMIASDKGDLGVGRDRVPGLGHDGAVDAHLSGEDQRAGAFARRGKAAFDDERVEAWLQLVRDVTHCAIAGSCPDNPAAARASRARPTQSRAIRFEASSP